MTNETITDLTLIDALADLDVAAFDDFSDTSTDPDFIGRPKTKKVTAAQILTYIKSLAKLNQWVVPDGSVDLNTQKIINLATPTLGTDAATKLYVDSLAIGLSIKGDCRVATTAALTVTYSNGTAGVGATLTNAGTQAAITIDTVALSVNDRVLVKNQASTFQNGIYIVTTVGSGATNWVLTRATDFDQAIEMPKGAWTIVFDGVNYPTGNKLTQWFQASAVTTIGTDPITFTGLSAAFLSSADIGVTVQAYAAELGLLAHHGGDIASATTTNLETATGDVVDVTGTTTITAITLADGHKRWVRFTGILTLTNGGSLVLPGGANITTAAGDYGCFIGYSGSVVRCAVYAPANGRSVAGIGTQLASAVAITGGSIQDTTVGSADSHQADARFQKPIATTIVADTTLGVSHWSKRLIFNSATAITITLPQQSTTATNAGVWFEYENVGAGVVTFIKQGAETITIGSNTTANLGARGTVIRDTTTNWDVGGGTANVIGSQSDFLTGTLVNQDYNMFIAEFAGTILAFTSKNTSIGTAGTYTVNINGSAVTGLSAIANSTTLTRTAATAANTFVAGDRISVTQAGMTSVVDMFRHMTLSAQV